MGEDASEIRREIEQTRARMSETVEAIGYKADVPARMKENVNDRIGTIRGTLGNVVDNVRSTVANAADAVTGAAQNVAGAASGAAQNVAGAAGGAAQNLTGAASAATSGLHRGANVAENVGNVAGNMAGNAADAARGGTQQARRAVSIATSNPLGLALAALAIGLIGGLLLPRTDIENEQLGPVRDRLKDQITESAQSAIGQAVDAGKNMVAGTLLNAGSNLQHTDVGETNASTTTGAASTN